jgi:ADP-ribose pyrophosphatase YjhB (NUDIX family)
LPISPYIRELRERVGTMRLLLPSVSAHVFDADGRMLLVRQHGGLWSTPGGLVEPDELPADAVVRETWEETGLHVRPERVVGVFGGPDFVIRYPHGDEAQYVIAAFSCAVVGGALRPDLDEIDDARFWSPEEAAALPLAAWLRSVLGLVYAGARGPGFEPPTWAPPAA